MFYQPESFLLIFVKCVHVWAVQENKIVGLNSFNPRFEIRAP